MSIKTSGAGATAAQNKYISKAYDRINLLVPKGDKEQIRAAADAAGQSVNEYIRQAIAERQWGQVDTI